MLNVKQQKWATIFASGIGSGIVIALFSEQIARRVAPDLMPWQYAELSRGVVKAGIIISVINFVSLATTIINAMGKSDSELDAHMPKTETLSHNGFNVKRVNGTYNIDGIMFASAEAAREHIDRRLSEGREIRID